MKQLTEKEQISKLIGKQSYTYDDLTAIIALLRSENGCPWDKAQTHETIRANAVEEAYELVDAINRNNVKDMVEELGDLLMQVTLHCQIAEDSKEFTYQDVYNRLCSKLIKRHSHIFGEDTAYDADSALATWEKNKVKEHSYTCYADHLRQVPYTTPSLMRAYKVQKRAAKVGFDWDEVTSALDKVEEETREVREAIAEGNQNHIEEEIGDLLFAMVNVSRFISKDPEIALSKATNKFINRFAYIEEKLTEQGIKLEDASLAQMDALWEQSKCK